MNVIGQGNAIEHWPSDRGTDQRPRCNRGTVRSGNRKTRLRFIGGCDMGVAISMGGGLAISAPPSIFTTDQQTTTHRETSR